MKEQLKDDENASIFDSSIDVGVQLPVEMEPTEEFENQDPECPWYNDDKDFEIFDSKKVETIIESNSEKFLLGVFPYGPNNQMRGFRDTILV